MTNQYWSQELSYTVDFILLMQWIDPRLRFYNLREQYDLNALSKTVQSKVRPINTNQRTNHIDSLDLGSSSQLPQCSAGWRNSCWWSDSDKNTQEWSASAWWHFSSSGGAHLWRCWLQVINTWFWLVDTMQYSLLMGLSNAILISDWFIQQNPLFWFVVLLQYSLLIGWLQDYHDQRILCQVQLWVWSADVSLRHPGLQHAASGDHSPSLSPSLSLIQSNSSQVNGIPKKYIQMLVQISKSCPDCDGADYLGSRQLVEYVIGE